MSYDKYYCKKLKWNVWVLGYFGGGSIRLGDFQEVANEFANEGDFNVEDVTIDEIQHSRRFKRFKFVYLNNRDMEQSPMQGSIEIEDLFKWLND